MAKQRSHSIFRAVPDVALGVCGYVFSLKDIRLSLCLEGGWILLVVCRVVDQSTFVLSCSAIFSLINIAGLVVAALFYRHNVRLVLNCTPRWDSPACLWAFLGIIRPLEIIWRFMTYRLRVLPDLLLVGETRCGTTSFAGPQFTRKFECRILAILDGLLLSPPLTRAPQPRSART
jgi:hypothetical protein